MVETICNRLTLKIRNKMPEVDEQRAEIINYGLQLLIGEIPKIFILFLIAYFLGVFKLTLTVVFLVTPYRVVSGGAHFKTHIGCILATAIFYIGNAVISRDLVIEKNILYLAVFAIWIFSFVIISIYAPADTEDVPILRKKERTIRKILSYIIVTIMLFASLIIKNRIIANILLIASFLQTIALTKFMYKIAGNKYGYEVYRNDSTL